MTDFQLFDTGDFQFTATDTDIVAAMTNRAILPVVLLDNTGSIAGLNPERRDYTDDVYSMLTGSIAEMRAKGVHEGAYFGGWYFSDDYRDTGFLREAVPLTAIDNVDVSAIPKPVGRGATPLYSAAFNGLRAVNLYGQKLDSLGIATDAFVVLVTDGRPEGYQQHSAADVKHLLAEIRDQEAEVRLSSLYFAVIGIGDRQYIEEQKRFANDVGADKYIHFGEITPGSISKLVGWFSSSVHLSQQVGKSVAIDDLSSD